MLLTKSARIISKQKESVTCPIRQSNRKDAIEKVPTTTTSLICLPFLTPASGVDNTKIIKAFNAFHGFTYRTNKPGKGSATLTTIQLQARFRYNNPIQKKAKNTKQKFVDVKS